MVGVLDAVLGAHVLDGVVHLSLGDFINAPSPAYGGVIACGPGFPVAGMMGLAPAGTLTCAVRPITR